MQKQNILNWIVVGTSKFLSPLIFYECINEYVIVVPKYFKFATFSLDLLDILCKINILNIIADTEFFINMTTMIQCNI